MKRLHKLIPVMILAVLLAAGLLVAGCGDSEEATTTTVADTETTAPATDTTAPSTESTTETSEASGDTIVLRLPMGPPDGDPLVVPVQEMAERFNSRVNGAYEIQCYPGGTLINPGEAMDACRTGAAEMAFPVEGGFATLDSRLGIIELPFIFNNVAALGASQNDDMVALYDSIISPQFNQKVLGLTNIGFVEIIGSKPVKTLDDWNGLLVGINSQSIVEVFQTLGAETVVIDWTESYSNLDKGVVDSVSAGTTYMWIAELYKVGKYSTWMSGIAGNYGIHINLDIWNAMPADIQQILDEEVKACCLELNQTHVDIQESNKQALVDGGCEVFVPDDTERDKWKAACESYVTEKLAGYGDFGTQFMAIVDEANAANP